MEDKLLYCVVEQDVADEDDAAITFLMTKKNFNKLKNKNCDVSWGQMDSDEYECTFEDIVSETEITEDQAKLLWQVGAVGIEAGYIVFEDDDIDLDDYTIENLIEYLIKKSADVEVFKYDDDKIFLSKSIGYIFGYDYNDESKLIEITDEYLTIEDSWGDMVKFSINRNTKTPKLTLVEEE